MASVCQVQFVVADSSSKAVVDVDEETTVASDVSGEAETLATNLSDDEFVLDVSRTRFATAPGGFVQMSPSASFLTWPATPDFTPSLGPAVEPMQLPALELASAEMPGDEEFGQLLEQAQWELCAAHLQQWQMWNMPSCWDATAWEETPGDTSQSLLMGLSAMWPNSGEEAEQSPEGLGKAWADILDEDIPDVAASGTAGQRTTVMLKNMPNNQSRRMLLELLDREGFAAQYDFVYLPMDFKTKACLGYAFVNFLHPSIAERCVGVFEGFSNWPIPSKKVGSVGWSGPHQGLVAHIERYRNSPVMHEDVQDSFKPILFKDGRRMAFPPPTKKLKAPRLRD